MRRWYRGGCAPEKKFSCAIKLIAVESRPQKYFRFSFDPNHLYIPAIPAQHEGRFAIVTDVGQGMRWTQAVPKTRALPCGRRSRVVLTPRRWRQVVAKKYPRGDGGKQSPVTRESAKQAVKTIRVRECRVIPVRPW